MIKPSMLVLGEKLGEIGISQTTYSYNSFLVNCPNFTSLIEFDDKIDFTHS